MRALFLFVCVARGACLSALPVGLVCLRCPWGLFVCVARGACLSALPVGLVCLRCPWGLFVCAGCGVAYRVA